MLVGWGGLFGLQGARSGATTTNLFIIGLGVLTFLFFAGPGIAFVLRKRIPFLKKHLPGGSLTWVRAHLYLPILALMAAYIHATSAPFRGTLSSGKVLLGIGIVVSICGVARHHLIGVSKAAVNADAQISRIASQHSRPFRQLVIDYKQLRRPLADIQADVQQLPPEEQAAWAQVLETQAKIDHDFPRGGGQSRNVRAYKLLRAIHAPLTVVLFIALSFHVVDVLGVTDTVTASDKERIASVSDCNGCHSEIVEDWKQSAMAHAQTGTIMEAQLPVTLAKNEELAKQLGAEQQDLVRQLGAGVHQLPRTGRRGVHRRPERRAPGERDDGPERHAGDLRWRRGDQPGRGRLRGVPHPVGTARRARRGRQDQHRQRDA